MSDPGARRNLKRGSAPPRNQTPPVEPRPRRKHKWKRGHSPGAANDTRHVLLGVGALFHRRRDGFVSVRRHSVGAGGGGRGRRGAVSGKSLAGRNPRATRTGAQPGRARARQGRRQAAGARSCTGALFCAGRLHPVGEGDVEGEPFFFVLVLRHRLHEVGELLHRALVFRLGLAARLLLELLEQLVHTVCHEAYNPHSRAEINGRGRLHASK